MIKHISSKVLIVLSFVLILFQMNSCLDPEWDFGRLSDEVVISPGFAAPLVYGSFTINDIIEEAGEGNEYITQDEDSLLYISFEEELMSYDATDLFEFQDQEFFEVFLQSDFVILPEWLGLPINDTITFGKRQNGEFLIDEDQSLDSVVLKSVDIVFDVESTFKHEGILFISSDSIIDKDGNHFRESVKISDASGDFSYRKVINISDYTLYLDNSQPGKTILPLYFELGLINSGALIFPSDGCDISMTMENAEFYSAFGYFGEHDLLVSDGEFKLEMFDSDDYAADNLLFADPIIHFNIVNSYGVPAVVDISKLQTYSRLNEVFTTINFDAGVNPFTINAPLNPGDTARTTFEISNENCNLGEALATVPALFFYEFDATTNPGGDGSAVNFVTDSSNMLVDLEIILPLWAGIGGFSVESREEFDFEDMFGEDTDIIDYFRLTLDVENEFPTNIDMQVYFQDADENTLDSLFSDEAFLISPQVNADDVVVNPEVQSKEVEFTKDKIGRIQNAKFALVTAKISTPGANDGEYVKFFSNYSLDYKLKVKTNLTVNSRDF